MARNDFMAAFLKGLYEGGVGNPAVNDAEQASKLDQQYKQAQLDAEARKNGMVPAGQAGVATAGGGSVTTAPGASVNVHPDTPTVIGAFKKALGGVLFPTSNPNASLNTSFAADPSQPTYAVDGSGNASVIPPGQPLPGGRYKIPQDKALTMLGSQQRSASKPKVKVSIDTSKPNSPAKIVGDDYKPGPTEQIQEMDTDKALQRLSSQGVAGARESIAQTFRDRLNFQKGQAAYGGQFGKNQLSLNTALGHVATASDAYDAIKNTNEKFLNVPINKLKTETDDPYVVSLGISLNALQDELANVFKGSGATDQEIGKWSSYLNENLTPSQYGAALQTIGDLLSSRMDALSSQQEKVSQGVASGNPLTPKAKKAVGGLKKKAVGGDGWGIQRVQ